MRVHLRASQMFVKVSISMNALTRHHHNEYQVVDLEVAIYTGIVDCAAAARLLCGGTHRDERTNPWRWLRRHQRREAPAATTHWPSVATGPSLHVCGCKIPTAARSTMLACTLGLQTQASPPNAQHNEDKILAGDDLLNRIYP